MTTVVFDGEFLATDSQSTRTVNAGVVSGEHCSKCSGELERTLSYRNKIVTPKDATFNGERVIALAAAGAKPASDGLIHAIIKNVDVNVAMKIAGSFHGSGCGCHMPKCTILIVCETKVWILTSGKVRTTLKEVTEFPVAIGTGGNVARFAIKRLGYNAIGGVACAIDVDDGSGGNINYVNCRDGSDKPESVTIEWSTKETDELIKKSLKQSKKPRKQ